MMEWTCGGYAGCRVRLFFFQAEGGIRDYDVTGVQTCALPIFAAPMVGDVAHMVAPDNAILLGAPGSEAGLIDNLRRLADDPALRTALGKANRARAEAEFDERRMLERYAALYGRAMGRPEFGR